MTIASREFEEIAASIKRTLDPRENVRITPHARIRDCVTGRLRDFDILLETGVSGHALRVGVECRRKKRSIDKPQIEAFVTKLRDCRIDKGVFISSSGFADEALTAAEHYGIICCHLTKVAQLPWHQLWSSRLRLRTNFQFHGEVKLTTVESLPAVPTVIEFPGGTPPSMPFGEIGMYIASLQEAEVGHHRRQIFYEPVVRPMAIIPGHHPIPIARIELDAEFDLIEVEPRIEHWLYSREGEEPSAGLSNVHLGEIGGKPLYLELTTTSGDAPSKASEHIAGLNQSLG